MTTGPITNTTNNNRENTITTSHDHTPHRGVAKDYYFNITSRPQLWETFRDLDNAIHFAECRGRLIDEATQNFVVDFGNDEAHAAFDLGEEDFAALLSSKRPKSLETRWINIWSPEHQRELVQTVTSNYKISARLQAMMVSKPVTPSQDIRAVSPKLTSRDMEEPEPGSESGGKSLPASVVDLEGGYSLEGIRRAGEALSPIIGTGFNMISLSQIVDKIWHFSSVDYGEKYLCLGYNSLHVVSGVDFGNSTGRPDGKRVWTWLLICDDGTVISIHENPFPSPTSLNPAQRQQAVEVIRRNTNLVFSAISSQHIASENSNALITTYVRNFPNETGTAAIKTGEGPSLLFYYLFDNWPANYSLVIGREHSYSAALDQLRRRMVERAQVQLIDDLHKLGRQLAVLKRIYQSYDLIVNRVLKRQRLLREEIRNAQPVNAHHPNHQRDSNFGFDFLSSGNTWKSNGFDEMNPSELGGIQLSSAAIGRFERLLDRIRLYALSEIDECLAEKESMTFMVFNLIAVKDSQAVERLTRTTILIAKATILFLPVTLMTSYFSTEIEELQGVYTVKQYWIAFAVLLVLSALVLAIYGWAADTVEGKTIYVSFAKSFYRSSVAAFGKRRKRKIV
ncbi:ADP-ribosylation factor [Histoplasma capsulatum G186AR]|uniref:ADP-ribosylation factor n=1 Tax=Ajellomyces capsulatus TaxID=5037 RepID=A0A8H7YZP0_AJECA|nr:ADP-ribosylation factor [Histoplasma capsulatum]QSS68061.1 ADP-ribosylation factor [Histoplasma capsulatum G186AR]